MYQPKDAAARLGVSPSTLRRWAGIFAAHLSPDAASADQPRRYAETDLELLAEVKRLLDAGVSVAGVKAHVAGRVVAGDYVVSTTADDAGTHQAVALAHEASAPYPPEVVTLLQEIADGQRELIAELRATRLATEDRAPWWDWLLRWGRER